MNVVLEACVRAEVDSVVLVWERDETGKAIRHERIMVEQTYDIQADTANLIVVATHEGKKITAILGFKTCSGECYANGTLEDSPEVEVRVIGVFKANVANVTRRSTGLKLPIVPKQLAALTKPTRRRDWVPRKYGR